MALAAGTQLGPYAVVEAIGAGGMGEVYRAQDTKLHREVAIKVLPDAFSRDKERLDRFEREARLLAQLNHPNVATLYGLEELEERTCIVMELVEGETLAERIARSPIPIDEAIPLFIQIAEGLEAAHEKGIVHRDLKPANIKVGPEGNVKILDFGLAKAYEGETSASALSQSPTMTKATAVGVILGAAAYMSPEQARGKVLDKRTDIWAFGCVLFEAFSQRVPFLGETVSDTIAKIIGSDPPWNALPPTIPVRVRDLLERCLTKPTRERLHDIADARIELARTLDEPSEQRPIRAPDSWRHRDVAALLIAVALTGALAWSWTRNVPTSSVAVTRSVIPLPP